MTVRNVLLIDDNDHQHELFNCYAMTTEGIELDHAVNLEEGIECLSSKTPHVIFLDNKLQPFSSFSETVPSIRQAGFDGKIVVISSDINDPQFRTSQSFTVHHCRDKADFSLNTFEQIIDGYFC